MHLTIALISVRETHTLRSSEPQFFHRISIYDLYYFFEYNHRLTYALSTPPFVSDPMHNVKVTKDSNADFKLPDFSKIGDEISSALKESIGKFIKN